MNPLRVAILVGDPLREPLIAVGLDAHSEVDVLLRCVDRVEALAAMRSGRVDVLIAVGEPAWFDHQCRAEASLAGIRVVVVGGTGEWDAWAASLPPDTSIEEIVATANESEAVVPIAPGGRSKVGKLIAVWGPKGSPGRTTIAIELACEIARTGAPTLLIDGDTYGGDVLQLVGVIEELPTIVWASRLAAKGEFDQSGFFSDVRQIGRGPVLLPGIPRAELWAEVSDFGWNELLGEVTEVFDFVVCDVGACIEPPTAIAPEADRDRLARSTIQRADHVAVVFNANPVGIKNLLWSFEELRALSAHERAHLVANRTAAKKAREAAQLIRSYIHKNVVVSVPDLTEGFANAVQRGVPLSELEPSSPMAGAMRVLAETMGARVPARGVLAKLGGR